MSSRLLAFSFETSNFHKPQIYSFESSDYELKFAAEDFNSFYYCEPK